MPTLTSNELRQSPEIFLSESKRPGTWQRTSGSTGVPIRVFHDFGAHQLALQAKYRFHQVWGLNLFDRMAWLWSSDVVRNPGWSQCWAGYQQAWCDYMRQRIRLPASNLSRPDLRDHLRRISAFRPRGLYCFSRAGHLLAREAIDRGFRCDSLKVCIISGESASEQMIDEIGRAFRVPVVMEYGCVEFGYVAGEWPDGTLRVREDVVLVETVARADGRYDIVLSTLHDTSFPLLRYKIGDVADAPLSEPTTGFAVLPKVSGRDDDQVIARDNRVIGSTSIDALFEGEYFEAVRRYRVHQDASGELWVEVEPSNPSRLPNEFTIRSRLEQVLGGFTVHVKFADSVNQTEAGKHRVVTSDLYAQRS
ncbi:MAG: hypothetical protein AAGF84_04065 [Planctomycetota bacterium]